MAHWMEVPSCATEEGQMDEAEEDTPAEPSAEQAQKEDGASMRR